MCFPGGRVVKNPPASGGDARDVGSVPGSGRSPGGGHGEEPGGLQSLGSQESYMTEYARKHTQRQLHTHTLLYA